MTYSELLRLDKQMHPLPQQSIKSKPKLASGLSENRTVTEDTTIPCNHDTMTPSNHDTTIPIHQQPNNPSTHNTKVPANQPAIVADNHTTKTRDMVHSIRGAVHRVGKETATYRLTRDEKVGLVEIVYQQSKVGIRTSENEIVRIGLNWLLQNHHRQGEGSMLSLVLEALRA
ncbi:MAG: hypothetical protein ACYCZF_17140 [Anaerolineae bacterium]